MPQDDSVRSIIFKCYERKKLQRSYLFGLQCKLYEDLLKLLVDKVNAKLFEAVLLEDLETIYVENTDLEAVGIGLHRQIDFL